MAKLSRAYVDQCDASWTVRYYRKGVPISTPQRITQLGFERHNGEVGYATIVHDTSSGGDCCGQLGVLEPFADEVVIHRGGKWAWSGWLLEPRYFRGAVSVRAFDMLGWPLVRLIRQDIVNTGDDLTEIFEDYWRHAIDVQPPAAYDLQLTPTGVVQDRIVEAIEARLSWDPMRELVEAGMDLLVLGNRIVAGRPDFGQIDITQSMFEGAPEVAKLGEGYANRFVVRAEAGTLGAAGSMLGDPPFPLVEMVLEDQGVTDQAGADAAAGAALELMDRPPRVLQTQGGASLNIDRAGGLDVLIPCMQVNYRPEGYCFGEAGSYRLASVSVQVDGKAETVTPVFEPLRRVG